MSNYNDLYNAAQYIISCMPSPYVLWTGGYVSDGDGPPAWGVNEPPPPASEVQRRGAFCAWVPNGIHRHMGLTIPNPYNSPEYDGGIVSYWDAYYDASEYFRLDTDYPDGTFVMSPYNSEAAGDQGHIAMVWHYQGQMYAVEWIFAGATWDYTIEESNSWGNYKIAIRPEVWVPLAGGTWGGSTGGGAKPAAVSDAALAAAIDPYLNNSGSVIVSAAKKRGLPLHEACGLVEQESGGQNIFGCDSGDVGDTPPYCHQPVTKERVRALIDSPHMNGVGLTQLTWYTFVNDAEALGGAHIPENQCLVGFGLLKNYLDQYSREEAYGAYNAGEGNRSAGVSNGYAASAIAKADAWSDYLRKVKPDKGGDVPDPVDPPTDKKYPYGWFGLDDQGKLTAVDVPKGTWAAFEKYEDGKLYLVGHSDPAWRKAKTKVHEVEYYEEGGEVVVKESDQQTYRYSKAEFQERYEVEEK